MFYIRRFIEKIYKYLILTSIIAVYLYITLSQYRLGYCNLNIDKIL